MTIAHIDKRGAREDGMSFDDTIVKLAQFQAASVASRLAALTDNNTAVSDATVAGVVTPFAGAAASGSNLATLADCQAAFTAVAAAVASVADRAKAICTAVGAVPHHLSQPVALYTDNSGATVSTTLAAPPAGVTGATTGANVAAANAVLTKLNAHLYDAVALTRIAAQACGVKTKGVAAPTPAFEQAGKATGFQKVIAAYDPTVLGAAGSPGVTKAEFDAAVARYFKDTKALTAVLQACVAAPAPSVVVFGNTRSTPLNP